MLTLSYSGDKASPSQVRGSSSSGAAREFAAAPFAATRRPLLKSYLPALPSHSMAYTTWMFAVILSSPGLIGVAGVGTA